MRAPSQLLPDATPRQLAKWNGHGGSAWACHESSCRGGARTAPSGVSCSPVCIPDVYACLCIAGSASVYVDANLSLQA